MRKLCFALGLVLILSIVPVHALCLEVVKNCTDAAGPGQPIHFWGSAKNCGATTVFDVTIYDDKIGGNIAGPQTLLTYEHLYFEGDYYPTETPSTNTVTATGYNFDRDVMVQESASATCNGFENPPDEEICRTPGFWGARAGTEKGGQNITQAVIDAAPGGSLSICGGILIDNTALLNDNSAEEAMCVSIRGSSRLQLARHLTAAALNCVMTNGNADCADTSIAALFDQCNDVCAANGDAGYCIDALDCFNNGGEMTDSMCKIGTCGGGSIACKNDKGCAEGILCVPTPGNCHSRDLVNEDLGLDFSTPGPASSPDKCNSAIQNSCNVFSCN